MVEKRYLGDAVYVEHDGIGNFIVTTENGFEVTNTVVLEPDVFEALLKYREEALKPAETEERDPDEDSLCSCGHAKHRHSNTFPFECADCDCKDFQYKD